MRRPNQTQNTPKTQDTPAWFGGLFIAVGGFIMLIAAGVIPVDPDSVHAPPWVLATVGLVFALGGAAALPAERDGWINHLLAILMVASLGAAFSWVAFGPGERQFSGGVSLGPLSVGSSGGPSMGRIMFAVGSVLLWALVFFMIHRYIRDLRRS